MKRFILKILLFISPVILLIAIPVYMLIRSGENFWNIDSVIRRSDKCLIGYAYNESNYDYLKWKALSSREKYTVVALGSSRVLEFRSQMFDSSFYNAGYTVHSVNAFVPFLQSIPKEKYPAYLIINLDQWMFNLAWDSLASRPGTDKWATSFRKIPGETPLVSVWKDLWSRRFSIFFPHRKNDVRYIGLNAVLENSGFRSDGSCLYGKLVKKILSGDTTAPDYNYRETLGWIDHGTMRFNYGDRINEKALSELDGLLQFCKANGIKLIAFLPPYADKVNKKMQATGRYAYMNAIYPTASKIFAKYGFELYNFSSLSSVGSNDRETLDGFHGGELTYIKILIKMLESNSVLNNVTSLKRLRVDAGHPINSLTVYEE